MANSNLKAKEMGTYTKCEYIDHMSNIPQGAQWTGTFSLHTGSYLISVSLWGLVNHYSIVGLKLQLYSLKTVQMAISPKFSHQNLLLPKKLAIIIWTHLLVVKQKNLCELLEKGRVKTTIKQGLYFSQKLTEFFHQTFLCLHTFVCGTQWGCNNN